MESINKLIVFFILLYTQTSFAKALPKLLTKQSLSNIRFLSNDGRYTYFQRRSGSLLLSTNYKVFDVIKGDPDDQYTIVGSKSRKYLLVEQTKNFNSYYGLRSDHNIYKVEFGKEAASELGHGQSPKLYLNDSWASWFEPEKRAIQFKSLDNQGLHFQILIGNTLNPYFIPQVVMPENDKVFFTDINNQGIMGVIEYNRKNGKMSPFFKAKSNNEKIEICYHNQELFIASVGLNSALQGSALYRFKINATDKSKYVKQSIYQSSQNDIGHFICDYKDNTVYFVKNLTDSKNLKEKYEVAQLNTTNAQVEILSQVNFASSLIDMDGLLLLPYRGEYYILEGNTKLITDSLAPEALSLPLPTPKAELKGPK